LVREGSDYWESMKHAPDVAAMKMRSRSAETVLLSDNDGLGSFCALNMYLPNND